MNKLKFVFKHSDYREKIPFYVKSIQKKSKSKLVFVCEFLFQIFVQEKQQKVVESFLYFVAGKKLHWNGRTVINKNKIHHKQYNA